MPSSFQEERTISSPYEGCRALVEFIGQAPHLLVSAPSQLLQRNSLLPFAGLGSGLPSLIVKVSLNSPDFSATRCRVGLHRCANQHGSLHDNYCTPTHRYPVLAALSPKNEYGHERIFRNPCLRCDERTRPLVICHTRKGRIVHPYMQPPFVSVLFFACPHSTCFYTVDCKKRFVGQ